MTASRFGDSQMSGATEYEITTDWGVMRFTSADVVGYWWEKLAEEMNPDRNHEKDRPQNTSGTRGGSLGEDSHGRGLQRVLGLRESA